MSRLRPLFSFYGSKWRLAPRYPAPKHDLIIEPFAGSAAYALTYPDRAVLLIDRDPDVVAAWRYLITASRDEVMALPDRVDEVTEVPEAARALVGYWLAKGAATPQKRATAWARDWWTPNLALVWGPRVRQRIADAQPAIRHWRLMEGDYTDAPDVNATWFIDPPYSGVAGRLYRHHDVDYRALARWCRSRPGQAIVCEDERATWLPFQPFASTKGTRRDSHEGIWTQP